MADTARIACIQWSFDRVDDFAAFAAKVERFARAAADYNADFLVYPELFTCEIVSAAPRLLDGAAAVNLLDAHTADVRALFTRIAREYRVNVIGGSHLLRDAQGEVRNVCFVALRDGTLHEVPKIHATPNERRAWGVGGGDVVRAIDTDRGRIGVAICYDSEFPELTRHLTDQGAEILFVPFCTDDRHGYLRVRYSSQARAIENQCYVALAGNVGILRNVFNLDVQYAQSAVLTPCDLPFAREGIAVEATANVEGVIVADVDLTALRRAREAGTVQNLKDRRLDLYGSGWKAVD